VVKRFDICLMNLDAEVSKDPKNTRPCVVISPDEMNEHVAHTVVAPVSASSGAYPTRIPIDLLGTRRFVVIDQIRTVDRDRLVKKIGELEKPAQKLVLDTLQEFFAE
jgi:mRNA interferase MazF